MCQWNQPIAAGTGRAASKAPSGGAVHRRGTIAALPMAKDRMIIGGSPDSSDGAPMAPLSRKSSVLTRFSPLVRQGLRFRRRFEEAKRSVEPVAFEWYRYDTFTNLFLIQHLLRHASLSLEEMVAGDPVLDLGAADGGLSFFLESLGYRVHAVDFSGCNMNRMQGLRKLAAVLASQVQIQDSDMDGRFDLAGRYGVALFLGTLYHLKNPFYALEKLAQHARFCFLSTRVARFGADRRTRLDGLPVAYLLNPKECNGDATNYFIFSPAGLTLLVKRAGWAIRACISLGPSESDPVSPEGDERMFLLLESTLPMPPA